MILVLGHSIMYEPIRNLIECMSNIGLMSKHVENISFFLLLLSIWGIWSLDMTPLSTPDTMKMINLALGHFIVYVTIRNLILGNMIAPT